jgi:protein required for attachment to host cells
MQVPNGSYVLVADGRKRLLARNDGDADAPRLTVVQATEDSNPRTSAQVTDAAGHAGGRGTGSGSMGEADAHDVEEERFTAETAALIGRAAQAGDFERLIVVAPPRTLGRLRRHYDAAVRDRIAAEIDKDLTGQPIDRIAALLAER